MPFVALLGPCERGEDDDRADEVRQGEEAIGQAREEGVDDAAVVAGQASEDEPSVTVMIVAPSATRIDVRAP